ncbi:uncharacterized protein DNG_02171 [Cephalotrichum gorgonifer]|uniref:Uncharacterized protein n=1 Tax=Cephalotrichum gorgonifer TaxID=2041049 RepID=A0AAE8SSD5_9PEZI|nr:uncharacterized protein DNG_02171 [Cephalotrichum gorgonifer]
MPTRVIVIPSKLDPDAATLPFPETGLAALPNCARSAVLVAKQDASAQRGILVVERACRQDTFERSP